MEKSEETKDIVEKEFVSFPDIAADVINVLLYQGKRITEAGRLLAGPTETVYQGKEKLRIQYEDLCKYELKDGKINIMYMIANQSRTDGKMLLRKAVHLPEGIRKQFQSDMRIVVDFLAEGEEYCSNRKIVHKAALIKMIKVLSGDVNVEGVEKWMEEQGIREEDEITVCELFDQYERKGRAKGEKYGEAKRLVADIENIMKFFHVTLEKACEGIGTTVNKYEEAKKLMI